MRLTRSEIIEKLKEILDSANDGTDFNSENCNESCRLNEDLGLSSVGMLYVVIAVEEEFNIRFDNVGMADFVTVADVVNYIEEKIK